MSTRSDLHRFIARHDLIPPGAGVIVGVSGGPDSLSLLHALCALAPAHSWRLHAAYLHHGLRQEADEEARFVARTAAAWGVGCTIERADVQAIARQPGVSLEEAGRQARYAFLATVARRLDADVVAVGHNADDQAETVIMHLLRGSGLAGLRGMLPSTPLLTLRLTALPPSQRPEAAKVRLVRPWLQTTRAEIWRYCEENKLQPRQDASNADTSFFRNQLRHEIMPQLQAINPRLTRILGRTAAALQGDYEVLALRRRDLWHSLARVQPGRVRFPLASFRALPVGDQRALVRRAIESLRPEHRNIAWEHSERLIDLVSDYPDQQSGGPYPLTAGVGAELNYDWLDIVAERSPDLGAPQIASPQTLSLPGTLDLGGDWRLTARRVSWPAGQAPPWQKAKDETTIWLPLEIETPLIVRPRAPGDRMTVFGLGGGKAITDLMTELKLPRPARPHWPLLTDASGEILWLVGQRPAEACRLAADADTAWEIHLSRPPGL